MHAKPSPACRASAECHRVIKTVASPVGRPAGLRLRSGSRRQCCVFRSSHVMLFAQHNLED